MLGGVNLGKGKNTMGGDLRNATFSEEKGELEYGGSDLVVFYGVALRAIFKAGRALLGSGAEVVWYEAGREVELSRRELILSLRDKMPHNQLVQMAADLFTNTGWGRLEIVLSDPRRKEAVVRIRNCALCRGEKSATSICRYAAGAIGGCYQLIFGVETICREIKCAAKGDLYCEFHVTQRML